MKLSEDKFYLFVVFIIASMLFALIGMNVYSNDFLEVMTKQRFNAFVIILKFYIPFLLFISFLVLVYKRYVKAKSEKGFLKKTSLLIAILIVYLLSPKIIEFITLFY